MSLKSEQHKWRSRRPLLLSSGDSLLEFVDFSHWVLHWLKVERVNGFAPSSQRWQRRILLLNHTRVLEPVRGSAPRYQTYKARASLTMLNRQEMVLRVEVPSTTCRLGGGRSMYLSYRSKSRIDCLFRLNVPKAVKWYSWLGFRQQPCAHPARIL